MQPHLTPQHGIKSRQELAGRCHAECAGDFEWTEALSGCRDRLARFDPWLDGLAMFTSPHRDACTAREVVPRRESIPAPHGAERDPGEDNLHQHRCAEECKERGAWWADLVLSETRSEDRPPQRQEEHRGTQERPADSGTASGAGHAQPAEALAERCVAQTLEQDVIKDRDRTERRRREHAPV